LAQSLVGSGGCPMIGSMAEPVPSKKATTQTLKRKTPHNPIIA
jgi:hypothetical protein